MGIKIITDSACDLTRDYIKNNNIKGSRYNKKVFFQSYLVIMKVKILLKIS